MKNVQVIYVFTYLFSNNWYTISRFCPEPHRWPHSIFFYDELVFCACRMERLCLMDLLLFHLMDYSPRCTEKVWNPSLFHLMDYSPLVLILLLDLKINNSCILEVSWLMVSIYLIERFRWLWWNNFLKKLPVLLFTSAANRQTLFVVGFCQVIVLIYVIFVFLLPGFLVLICTWYSIVFKPW